MIFDGWKWKGKHKNFNIFDCEKSKMIKSEFTFRKFFDTFVPGFVVVFGLWYLYKPYINKYFPLIAFDPLQLNDNTAVSNELKLILILIASIFLGIIINHFSDIPVALMYKYKDSKKNALKLTGSDKLKYYFIRCIGVLLILRLFVKNDPRKIAMIRYSNSRRRNIFNSMLSDWCNSNINTMLKNNEEITLHQHICVKIRTLTPFSLKLFDDCYSEVIFASSLQLSNMIIFCLTLVLLLLNLYHDFYDISSQLSLKFIENTNLIFLLGFEFIFLFITTYSVMRSFRHFSNQILTIAFHLYNNSNSKKSV